jgi:signal transduction histidine kinase
VTRVLPLAVLVTGGVVGLLSFSFARSDPGYALAGDSVARAAAELAVGYALIGVGIVSWLRRPGSRWGVLLAAAGIAWFLAEWGNPGVGAALIFTIGLTLYGLAPPLVAHAVLAYPHGRLPSWGDRVALAVAYLGAVVVLGLLPAFFFDPAAQGCGECPANLLLVDHSPGLFDDLNTIGVWLGLGWSLVLAALVALRLARSTPALRRLVWPVVIAGSAYLGLVGLDFAHSLDRGFLSNDPTDVGLRLAQAGALAALSLAVAWSWLRDRRTRGAVARVVVQLAQSPAPGGLRDALARTLGDPSLGLGYPLGDGRLVDARGRTLALEGQVTPLVRAGREVAFLSHRPGLLDDPGLAEQVAAAARLALENERLQAEAAAQLEDQRRSRARVIATGDAERRRLERDLHDGAQQRLVGLALSLRLARLGVGPEPDPSLLARIDDAEGELRIALAELRELAHGIFPAVLADHGLAAALEALAEEAPIPIEITRLPDDRFEAPVEAAGYFVVSEALRRGAASALTVGAARLDSRLVIEVACDGAPEDLVDLEDRVGALDGSLEVVHRPGGRVSIRAEIPCGS